MLLLRWLLPATVNLDRNLKPKLADDVQLVGDSGRRLLRSASDRTCVVPPTHNSSATEAFLLPDPECGTLYLKNSDRTQASDSLGANWNRTCLSRLLNHGTLWQIVFLRLINILAYLLTYFYMHQWTFEILLVTYLASCLFHLSESVTLGN